MPVITKQTNKLDYILERSKVRSINTTIELQLTNLNTDDHVKRTVP